MTASDPTGQGLDGTRLTPPYPAPDASQKPWSLPGASHLPTTDGRLLHPLLGLQMPVTIEVVTFSSD